MRRPMLLALVYGVFLVLVAGMAAALALIVSSHFSSAMLGSTVAHDRALVGLWADSNLGSDEIQGGTSDARRVELEAQLDELAARSGMVHIELVDTTGVLLLSSDAHQEASAVASNPDFALATGGSVAAQLAASAEGPGSGPRFAGPVIQEFLPLIEADGRTAAVVAIWRDARPMLMELESTRSDVLILTTVGAGVLAIVLSLVFRAANRRLQMQSRALIETTRRDPLTGMLNHGAAVAAMAERLELARGAGASLSMALIDVDGFRLLNETHGHAAGDSVLSAVATLIGKVAPSGCVTGRYGPDEFIVVGPPVATEVVDHVVQRVREGLRKVTVRFGNSEALPITVSAGLATFPQAALGATDLLLAAANAAGEAKASGGDAVRTSGATSAEPAPHPTFNALQGLVIAVDNKDRYTKRHSEDVARYAVFLGRQVGLASAQLEQLRLAGLLHDVGKVGIPDALLRKPGSLTLEEKSIVEQHVALGDLIVRDLPDIAVVRAGVRHHHERWDGAGYLDHLAGEEIPMIARILAVCDTFSAMTTTRPYRKAMSVNEALKRLGDAAGSQLDERLVAGFIKAMDTAADAPRPEDETSARAPVGSGQSRVSQRDRPRTRATESRRAVSALLLLILALAALAAAAGQRRCWLDVDGQLRGRSRSTRRPTSTCA